MSSISHLCGGDLLLGKGGLHVISGAEETRQRLLRRLLTNPGDYIWQPEYGVGLQSMVGEVVIPSVMQAAIRVQVLKDPGVDPGHSVDVTVSAGADGFCLCHISYVDADTGQQQTLDFSA